MSTCLSETARMSGSGSGSPRRRGLAMLCSLALTAGAVTPAVAAEEQGTASLQDESAAATAAEHLRIHPLARRYVDLNILLGHHDEWTAGAFFGPASWRERLASERVSLEEILVRAQALRRETGALLNELATAQARSRLVLLHDEMGAFIGQIQIMAGAKFPADEEATRLYFVDPRLVLDEEIDAARAALDRALPGRGPLHARQRAYRERVMVNTSRMPDVMRAASEECRRRVSARLPLPEDRGLNLVVQKAPARNPGGDLLYPGNFTGSIQAPTSEKSLDDVFATACHEGYLGHYLRALLRERQARKADMPELYVWMVSGAELDEGTAEIGPEVAFSADELRRYFHDVLAPLAGIDAEAAAASAVIGPIEYRLKRLVAYEATRRVLARESTVAEASRFMQERGLLSAEWASGWLRWVKQSAGTYALLYQTGYARFMAEVDAAVASGTAPDRFAAFLAIVADPRRR